jgi:hypothetical protein
MRRALTLTLGLLATCAASVGCTSSVFNTPVTLSTKSDAVNVTRRLQQVSVEQCDVMVVLVPVVSDPASLYDELLARAEQVGGNAVLDMQIRYARMAFAIPFYTQDCAIATGTAAIVE